MVLLILKLSKCLWRNWSDRRSQVQVQGFEVPSFHFGVNSIVF